MVQYKVYKRSSFWSLVIEDPCNYTAHTVFSRWHLGASDNGRQICLQTPSWMLFAVHNLPQYNSEGTIHVLRLSRQLLSGAAQHAERKQIFQISSEEVSSFYRHTRLVEVETPLYFKRLWKCTKGWSRGRRKAKKDGKPIKWTCNEEMALRYMHFAA